VSASSRGAGQGSTFLVRLPVVRQRGTPATDEDEDTAAPRPARVLVVDDNRDSAESIAMLIELWGHAVVMAYDGPGALAAIAEHQPDVVLLDIGLPGMNGYQVAERVRATYTGGGPQLWALTGYGQDDDVARGREVGFAQHLVKPVAPAKLKQLLAELRL
jgi:two-component system CheB/CheR fusion protein